TRLSQAARLTVGGLQADCAAPRVLLPSSRKGGRHTKKSRTVTVPITPALANRLGAEAQGRAADEPLLRQPDGRAWGHSRLAHLPTKLFRQAVERAKLDPTTTTSYALRHSSITRALLRNVPVRVVAALHDTSIGQIERNYSAFISDHADSIARPALLEAPR